MGFCGRGTATRSLNHCDRAPRRPLEAHSGDSALQLGLICIFPTVGTNYPLWKKTINHWRAAAWCDLSNGRHSGAPECGAFLGVFLSICILCLYNKVILTIAATGSKSPNIISLAGAILAAVMEGLCARVRE